MARTSSRLAALVLTSALVVAGCSDSKDDASSETTTSVAVATDSTSTTTEKPGDTAEPLERYTDYTSENYDDPSHWVCRPDLSDDPCHGDLDTTVIAPDGGQTVEKFRADENAPIDCFYVYPTISQDKTPYSDWDADPNAEGFVTVQQAARLRSVCRVFAPVYRQMTLTSLTSRMGGGEPPEGPQADPIADVTDAFRTYMAQDNNGRGFVLIGHSQGAGLLKKLLADEIDPNEDVRDKLVGAYLAGTSFAVPEGELVGGDLQNIPVCSEPGEAGCITTWSTYEQGQVPESGAIFGTTNDKDQPSACVNPADGEDSVSGYYPALRNRSILAAGDAAASDEDLTWGAGPPVATPFVALPGKVTAECRSDHGVTYLSVQNEETQGDVRPGDLGGRITPQWGLHLLDVNLVMGDIVRNVKAQGQAWN